MTGLSFGLAALIVFVLGASIGSFLNVVIYRVPAGLSVLHPPSRCPHCLQRLNPYDNVPVLGWLWLKGRCRFCHYPIAARYPIVEASTGFLFVVVFWIFGFSLATLGYWAFFSWLLALALIDLDTLTLPNPLTQSGLLLGLSFQAIDGWLQGGTLNSSVAQLWIGMLGAVVGIWVFDLVALGGALVFGQTAMGGGDAKLAALMGAWLGWGNVLLAGFLACVLGAVVGGGGMALGILNRRQPIPFGPFLALAAILVTLWGNAIVSTYLQIFFPTL